MTEFKTYRGTYIGLADLTKTGPKKDGSTYTLNKMNFTHAEGKNIRFSTFEDITGVQPNQNYTVVFVEEEHATFKQDDGVTPIVMKKATKITPHVSDAPLGFEQLPQTIQPQAPVAQPGTTPAPIQQPQPIAATQPFVAPQDSTSTGRELEIPPQQTQNAQTLSNTQNDSDLAEDYRLNQEAGKWSPYHFFVWYQLNTSPDPATKQRIIAEFERLKKLYDDKVKMGDIAPPPQPKPSVDI